MLTSPITFGSVPAEGAAVTERPTGNLTLHGVAKAVTVQLQATWTSTGIQVAGSVPISFSDFHISTPTIGGFVSVEDHGTMEFDLVFVKG